MTADVQPQRQRELTPARGDNPSPVPQDVYAARDAFKGNAKGYAELLNSLSGVRTGAESLFTPAEQLLHHASGQPSKVKPTDAVSKPADAPPAADAPVTGQTARDLEEQAFRAMNKTYPNYPHHQWAQALPFPTEDDMSAWPLGQQIEATIAAGKLGDPGLNTPKELSQRLDALHYYWDNHGTPGYNSDVVHPFTAHDRFYDDNDWIGLALLNVYQQDKSQGWALDRAKQIFQLEKQGAEQGAKSPVDPGGVMWQSDGKGGNDYRATVSTAGAVQLALRLNQLDARDPQYLQFAKQQFDWVNQHLSNSNGLYMDHEDPNGNKDPAVYPYNQGLMMNDAAMLYQATGDEKYKQKAEQIMNAATQYFTEDKLEQQQPIFNAIYFKNLLQTDDTLHVAPEVRAQHMQMIEQYAEYLRKHMDSNGVVNTRLENDEQWKNLTQSAAVQIFGMLAQ